MSLQNFSLLHIATSVWNVLAIGLVLGAGIPVLYTAGLVLQSLALEHGISLQKKILTTAAHIIYLLCLGMILVGVLYVCHESIQHYLHIKIF